MTELDLESMTLNELKALQKDVAKAITSFEARHKKEALAAAKAAAKEYGYDLDELTGAKTASKAKAPAKYRHPENPELTWSGRGRKPAWFKEAEESGVAEADLLI